MILKILFCACGFFFSLSPICDLSTITPFFFSIWHCVCINHINCLINIVNVIATVILQSVLFSEIENLIFRSAECMYFLVLMVFTLPISEKKTKYKTNNKPVLPSRTFSPEPVNSSWTSKAFLYTCMYFIFLSCTSFLLNHVYSNDTHFSYQGMHAITHLNQKKKNK